MPPSILVTAAEAILNSYRLFAELKTNDSPSSTPTVETSLISARVIFGLGAKSDAASVVLFGCCTVIVPSVLFLSETEPNVNGIYYLVTDGNTIAVPSITLVFELSVLFVMTKS